MEQENKRSMQEELSPVAWSWKDKQTAQQNMDSSEMSEDDVFQNINRYEGNHGGREDDEIRQDVSRGWQSRGQKRGKKSGQSFD